MARRESIHRSGGRRLEQNLDVYAVGNVGFDLMHQVDKKADLILSNARVLTFSPDTKCWSPGTLEISRDRSEVPSGIRFMPGFVAVKGNRILGVGEMGEAHLFEGPDTKEIDCRGMALAPGFNDAHCHLLALASSLRGVDCRPDKVRSITQIVSAINRRAESTPPSTFPESQNHGRECTSHGAPWGLSGKRWIRAFGYDEFYLAEGRHPTRWDLDRASAFHPIRLDHRTGHASVLNSRALDLLDISRATPDPSDGVIERDEATGEPTGVLFGMASYIREVTEPRRDEEETLEGVRRANEMILSKGITSIQDASPANDLLRWESFKRLKEEGHLTPRVTMMVGASHLHSCLDVGLTPGSGDDGLRVGAVKLVLSLVTGALQPHLEELNEIVLRAHERGFQIAIHAVEEEAVEAVAEALIKVQAALPLPNVRHRIEHCSECPPRVLEKVRGESGLGGHPAFFYLPQRRKVPLTC